MHIDVADDRSQPPGTDPALTSAAEQISRQLNTVVITRPIYPLVAVSLSIESYVSFQP
jgi:hypothetical protein